MRFSSDRGITLVSTAALALLALLVCLHKPGVDSWWPPCPLYALTGFYCPGCGSTRMLYWLLRGNPLLAFRQNPLAMIMLPIVIYGLVRQWISRDSAVFTRIRSGWIVAFAVVVIAFAVARNIPTQPFCQLAPGGECRVSSSHTR
jgi:hypothetical protein